MSLLSCICGAGASPGQHPNPTFFAPSLTFLACGSLLVLITGPELFGTCLAPPPRPRNSGYLMRLSHEAREHQRSSQTSQCTAPYRPSLLCTIAEGAESLGAKVKGQISLSCEETEDHQLPHTCLGIGSTSPDPSSNVFSG